VVKNDVLRVPFASSEAVVPLIRRRLRYFALSLDTGTYKPPTRSSIPAEVVQDRHRRDELKTGGSEAKVLARLMTYS
jgi:hypothetical protein